MEVPFLTVLFGISHAFWLAVGVFVIRSKFISNMNKVSTVNTIGSFDSTSFGDVGSSGLVDRGMYSRQTFVVADFRPVTTNYSVNRLYILVIISLAVMSFVFITYGLHSAFPNALANKPLGPM